MRLTIRAVSRKIRVYYRWLRRELWYLHRYKNYTPCNEKGLPHTWVRGRKRYYCTVCRMRAPFVSRVAY